MQYPKYPPLIQSTTPEPAIRGSMNVECAEDAIFAEFYTSIPFEGIIYVMGQREASQTCIGVHAWVNLVSVIVPHSCGVVKER
jgi:hypothetical protein